MFTGRGWTCVCCSVVGARSLHVLLEGRVTEKGSEYDWEIEAGNLEFGWAFEGRCTALRTAEVGAEASAGAEERRHGGSVA